MIALFIALAQSVTAAEIAPVAAEAAYFSPGLVETRVALSNDGSQLALRDLDGDGDQELLRLDRVGVAVRMLGATGAYDAAEALLRWPGKRIILQDLDKAGDGGESVIDLGEIDRFAMAPGAALRELATEREPVVEASLFGVSTERRFRGIDLKGDGKVDLMATGRDEDNVWRVQLFVRR